MKRIALKAILLLAFGALLLLSGPLPEGLAQQKNDQSDNQKPQAAAQTTPQPQLLSVSIVRIKPDMVTEWQAFEKNVLNPALQKSGIKVREAFATVFGDAYEYGFVMPITGFAQYDGGSPVVKALGEEGARSMTEKLRRFHASLRSYAVRTRPDLSYYGKTAGPPKLFVVAWINVAPGRSQEFETFVKNDLLPVVKKSDAPAYLVSQVVYGGASNQYVSLTAHDNFADLDKGPLSVQVLGQEGANKLAQKAAGIVTHIEYSVVRFVPDLSIMPPPQAASK